MSINEQPNAHFYNKMTPNERKKYRAALKKMEKNREKIIAHEEYLRAKHEEEKNK
jgi:hypothetical protein